MAAKTLAGFEMVDKKKKLELLCLCDWNGLVGFLSAVYGCACVMTSPETNK